MTNDRSVYTMTEEWKTLYRPFIGHLYSMTSFLSGIISCFRRLSYCLYSRYEIALEGRCLGERFKMIVPPHLAYGDRGKN